MKHARPILIFSIILILLSLPAFSHPGRTDSSGCHTCRTNCEEKYNIPYGFYHRHNPLRACHEQKTLPKPEPVPEPEPEPEPDIDPDTTQITPTLNMPPELEAPEIIDEDTQQDEPSAQENPELIMSKVVEQPGQEPAQAPSNQKKGIIQLLFGWLFALFS